MSVFSRFVRFILRKNSWLLKTNKVKEIFFNNHFLRDAIVVPHNLRHFLALEMLQKMDPEDYVFLVDSRDLICSIFSNGGTMAVTSRASFCVRLLSINITLP